MRGTLRLLATVDETKFLTPSLFDGRRLFASPRLVSCSVWCSVSAHAFSVTQDAFSQNASPRLVSTVAVCGRPHGLNLNVNKCKAIIIGTSRLLNTIVEENIVPVEINEQIIKFEKDVVNLGLRISNTLSWSNQVNHVTKMIYKCLYQFRHLRFQPSFEIRKQLIVTLVFPIIDYAIAAYCDMNNEQTNQLQRAQNACVRYIFKLKYYDHVTPYYKQLKWLKIRERRELNVLNLAFKTIKYCKPDYLYENYIVMRNVHLRTTRFGQNILQFPIHRTVTYSNSFLVTSIRLLNGLDNDIKRIDGEHLFSNKVKELLLNRY